MIDAILSALLDSVGDGDPATLAALADRLLEVCHEDRLEALRRFAELTKRLRECRLAVADSLMRHGGGQKFAVSARVPRDVAESRIDHVERMRADLLRRLGEGVAKAVEQGHWFAVRFMTTEADMDEEMSFRYYMTGQREIRIVASVVPLDGGQIQTENRSPSSVAQSTP